MIPILTIVLMPSIFNYSKEVNGIFDVINNIIDDRIITDFTDTVTRRIKSIAFMHTRGTPEAMGPLN